MQLAEPGFEGSWNTLANTCPGMIKNDRNLMTPIRAVVREGHLNDPSIDPVVDRRTMSDLVCKLQILYIT